MLGKLPFSGSGSDCTSLVCHSATPIGLARSPRAYSALIRSRVLQSSKPIPDDTELVLEEARLLLEAKEFDKAEANLLRLVETSPAPYFGSADDGVRGFHTRHTLAGNYLEHQRPREARNFEQ